MREAWDADLEDDSSSSDLSDDELEEQAPWRMSTGCSKVAETAPPSREALAAADMELQYEKDLKRAIAESYSCACATATAAATAQAERESRAALIAELRIVRSELELKIAHIASLETAASCCRSSYSKSGTSNSHYASANIHSQEKGTKNKPECCVCMEEDANTLMEPCMHIVVCGKCAERLSHCPVCRAAKRATKRVYM